MYETENLDSARVEGLAGGATTTRRGFLARASLLGLGVPAFSALVAGCGEGGEQGEAAQGEAAQGSAAQGTAPGAGSDMVAPFRRYDPELPPVGPGREHDLVFVVRDVNLPIAPGVAMRAWTFNGTIPGPIMHVRQGDTVRVHLINEGTIPHSIDLHAAQIDTATAFRSIAPGQSLSYTFQPRHAGAFLYHCGTEPIGFHIGSGMYGAIIVDPPSALPPAREFVLVHSSFYLDKPQGTQKETGAADAAGAAGQKGSGAGASRQGGGGQAALHLYDPSYEKMLFSFPDYTAFNGHSFQYRAEPIRVKRGERTRFYVVSAGPTHECSFHVVGEIFETVYLGAPPGNRIEGVQSYMVPSGGGMIFDIVPNVPGTFVFVDHKMGHGDKGAKGVLIVEP